MAIRSLLFVYIILIKSTADVTYLSRQLHVIHDYMLFHRGELYADRAASPFFIKRKFENPESTLNQETKVVFISVYFSHGHVVFELMILGILSL